MVGYCDQNEGISQCVFCVQEAPDRAPRVVLNLNFVALLLVGCYTLVAPIGGARFRWLVVPMQLSYRPAGNFHHWSSPPAEIQVGQKILECDSKKGS